MSRSAPQARSIRAGSIEIACESFGDPACPAILLLMGNSAPGLVWPDAFCAMLASTGRFVLRFDQRDTGLSSYFDFAAAPYTLEALVDDAFAVLDAYRVAVADIVGLSQGGSLAYRMALRAPDRVRSIATIMSSPCFAPKNNAFMGLPQAENGLSAPAADYVAAVIALNAAPADGVVAQAARFADNFRLAKGPRSPFDEAAWAALGRAFAERPLMRADGLSAAIANGSNHGKAQSATPDLTAEDLAGIGAPVLVIHGGGDPIFPPDHARWAVAALSDARLLLIDAMGHALDPAFFVPVADALDAFWRGQISVLGP